MSSIAFSFVVMLSPDVPKLSLVDANVEKPVSKPVETGSPSDYVEIKTPLGSIVIRLRPDAAPLTVSIPKPFEFRFPTHNI
jgi:hypothetical protein